MARFLSGIAIGNGGAALEVVQHGVLAATPLGALRPWRLVLTVLGLPSLIWSMAATVPALLSQG